MKALAKEVLRLLVIAAVVAVVCFGFMPKQAPPTYAPAPNPKAMLLEKIKFSALVKDTAKPDADWSDKPIEFEAQCAAWVAQVDGDIAKVATDQHCVDKADAIKTIQQLADPKSAILAMFGMDTESTIVTKDPGGDGLVARQVSLIPSDSVTDADSLFAWPDTNGVPPQDHGATAQVVAELPKDDGDLALLRVSASDLGKPVVALPLATEQGNVGDPVAAAGYPGANLDTAPRLVTTFGRITSKAQMIGSNHAPSITIDAASAHGMSGGPVVNSSGQVVAHVDFGYDGDDARVYPGSLTVLTDFLGSNGIHPAQAKPLWQSAMPYALMAAAAWVAWLVIASFVMAIVGACLLISSGNRKTRAPAARAYPYPVPHMMPMRTR